jgi:hypothetical protein
LVTFGTIALPHTERVVQRIARWHGTYRDPTADTWRPDEEAELQHMLAEERLREALRDR